MWTAEIIDTRNLGAFSYLLDGFIHILPSNAMHLHLVNINCWCEPRVLWCPEQGTCIVSHRHLRLTEYAHA